MERRMRSVDETRMIGEAWAHATSLSTDGQLQQAIMGFLRLRTILQDQKRKLRCFDTVCAGRDRLPGSTSRGTGAAQAAALPTGARKGAGAVIGKLLSKVDEELRSHLQFLQNNPYAALQLPLPRGAGSTTSHPSWAVSDSLVKNNYRRLALRFHPDKTGGTDSSPLFAAIRTAYETLATSRDRALYKAGPTGHGGAEFRWAVEVGAPSIQGSPGGDGAAGTASSQGSVRPAKEECLRRSGSREETANYSSGSSDALFDQGGCRCRGNATAGFQKGLGASRWVRREGGGRDTQERDEPGSDDEKGQQQQETGYAQDYAGIGVEGQGGGLSVEGHAGFQVESNPGTPAAAPKRTKGHEKEQHPDKGLVGEGQGREGDNDGGGGVGLQVGHHSSVGAERFPSASHPSDSSPAPFAGEGGAHRPIPPFAGRQQPRKQLDGQSEEENGGVGAHRCRQTTVSARTGSPFPPPSQPAATQAASCARTSIQPPPEKTAVVCDPEVDPSGAASASGSSLGERAQTEGERPVESSLSHRLFREQGLEIGSDFNDDTSSSGGSGGGGACNGGGGGGGCVQRLRGRVTIRGRDQHHNATTCTSPTYAYELQKEVDFWVSGARREGVTRKHAPADGGTVRTVTEGSTSMGVGRSESTQETLHLPRQRRRGRVLISESGGDAVDGLVRATMSGDEGRKDDLRNSVKGKSAAAAAAAVAVAAERVPPPPHSFEEIEISTTTVGTGAGRGWFWGAAT